MGKGRWGRGVPPALQDRPSDKRVPQKANVHTRAHPSTLYAYMRNVGGSCAPWFLGRVRVSECPLAHPKVLVYAPNSVSCFSVAWFSHL